jgi:hypothetical protein
MDALYPRYACMATNPSFVLINDRPLGPTNCVGKQLGTSNTSQANPLVDYYTYSNQRDPDRSVGTYS